MTAEPARIIGASGGLGFGLAARWGQMLRLGMASGAFTPISDQDAAARQVNLVHTSPPDPSALEDVGKALLAAC